MTKKIKTIFVSLSCNGDSFDYPSNLPLPSAGETIVFNDNMYIVIEIKHIVGKVVAHIIIYCVYCINPKT